MMFVDKPVPGHDERAGTLVRRAAAADQHLALCVLTGRHGLDLVLGERRVPAEDRLEGVVDRLEERVDRAVPGRLGNSAPSPLTLSVTVPDGVAAMRRGHAPADEHHARLDLGRALLDERHQVGVGHLLLRVGELDGLAVDRVERVALELVAELAQLALQTRAGPTACRSSAGCRTARPTAGS